MDPIDLPYKTTFAAQIRTIEPSEQDLNEAKASLADLKRLLPAGIDPEDNPQLLYIAANLYVAGMVNLNDDGVDLATSLAAYKGFEKQQLNIEHDRKRIAGYILHAGLSEFGTDRLITEDEAREQEKPFNVAVVAVLWKVANRELCGYLEEASNPMHPDYKALSLSFEVGFSSYNIGVFEGDERDIAEAKQIIVPADANYVDLSSRLRANGGSGKLTMDGNERLYQILSGTFLPLGGGIVTAPAAAVKGIAAITQAVEVEEVEEDDETEEASVETQQKSQEPPWMLAQDLKSKLLAFLEQIEKNSLSCIKQDESRVSTSRQPTIINSNMKNLQELKEKLASANTKPEDLQQICAGAIEIADAITKKSEELYAQLEAEKNRSAEIEKTRAEAQAANDTLAKSVADLQKQLSEIKAAQDAAAAELKFDERMAEINEEFDLADDERALIIDEVKSLDDEAYAAWMTKAKKLMKEKSKSFKKEQSDKQKDKNEKMCSALAAKGIKVTMDENDLIKEVIASAQSNVVSTPITNVVEVNSQSLADRVREEFINNMSIGGKKIAEYKKKE